MSRNKRYEEAPASVVNLTPRIMAQATVARATEMKPTSAIEINRATWYSQGVVSKMLAEMRESGEAGEGYYAKWSEKGRVVTPVAGTDLLRERANEDPHLRRAVGILEFAERWEVGPGEALDKLLDMGRQMLEASDVAIQTPDGPAEF
jgi:hypothetical protein